MPTFTDTIQDESCNMGATNLQQQPKEASMQDSPSSGMEEEYDLLATAFESIKDANNEKSDFDMVSLKSLSSNMLDMLLTLKDSG